MARKDFITRIFTQDEIDEWDLPWGATVGMIKLNEIKDIDRWSVWHEIVFQAPDDGKLWRLSYQVPATEQQDCDRWPDLEGVQVQAHEVTVIEYRQVRRDGDTH